MASVTFDHVSKQYPNGHLGVRDMSLEIADGELLVLVGPSGCGKSTALRSVAGLEDITEGELRIGDRVVQDLPPKDRDVAMVFQNYALYPHMTVAGNIGFALKLARRPKEEIQQRVKEVAQSLQLEHWLDRKPAQLSGGQRQRVAMGRAIVRDPAVFLMDEPLSNLDAKLRVQVRTEIARLQRQLGTTTIYVTHDQTEAMTMGDRVAVMREGALQQVASPEVLYDAPDNTFVAAFIGSPAMSLLEGRIERVDSGIGVRLGSQLLPLPPSVSERRPALAGYVDRPVVVGLRPEHLDDGEVGRREGDVTAPLDVHVELRESLGSEVLLHVSLDARPALTEETRTIAADVDDDAVASLERQVSSGRAAVIARVDPRSHLRPDADVQLAVRTDALHFFDPEDGRAIRDAS
jgi:multiple sugar transport system ATP-binding protein